jgi:hypothetical protein
LFLYRHGEDGESLWTGLQILATTRTRWKYLFLGERTSATQSGFAVDRNALVSNHTTSSSEAVWSGVWSGGWRTIVQYCITVLLYRRAEALLIGIYWLRGGVGITGLVQIEVFPSIRPARTVRQVLGNNASEIWLAVRNAKMTCSPTGPRRDSRAELQDDVVIIVMRCMRTGREEQTGVSRLINRHIRPTREKQSKLRMISDAALERQRWRRWRRADMSSSPCDGS